MKQRLAAILAADAAGYSRAMAADERATVAALDACRAVFRRQIEAHHGRIVDTAGDSVLALLETASGAVQAALAIQAELRGELRFRIGVHLGEVLEKPDGSVYGDGVNVAARLQALASPGEVAALPSIAVLPFKTIGGDAEQASFADGLRIDIQAALVKIAGLALMAVATTNTYRNKEVSPQQAAAEMGARYVLEGLVQKSGSHARIHVTLTDAPRGRSCGANTTTACSTSPSRRRTRSRRRW